jgi:hypothetical protein
MPGGEGARQPELKQTSRQSPRRCERGFPAWPPRGAASPQRRLTASHPLKTSRRSATTVSATTVSRQGHSRKTTPRSPSRARDGVRNQTDVAEGQHTIPSASSANERKAIVAGRPPNGWMEVRLKTVRFKTVSLVGPIPLKMVTQWPPCR